MRLASLRSGGLLLPALLIDGAAYAMPLEEADRSAGGGAAALLGPALFPRLDELHARTRSAIERGESTPHPLSELGPPVPRPGKIICIGRNYGEHARELGNELPARPILFAKFATALRGPFDDVIRPREVDDLDYEAELCVVIGSAGRRIPVDRSLDHVFGYCCANDLSARTAQLGLGDQWLRGKSYDGFCPTGPAVVTRDEVADPQRLGIRCRVDGETRQDGNTSDMVFDVATLVSYISDAFTLEPGDLILTGTPAGVAMGRTPSPWLQPGQVCEVDIDGLGSISNRIVADDVDSAA